LGSATEYSIDSIYCRITQEAVTSIILAIVAAVFVDDSAVIFGSVIEFLM